MPRFIPGVMSLPLKAEAPELRPAALPAAEEDPEEDPEEANCLRSCPCPSLAMGDMGLSLPLTCPCPAVRPPVVLVPGAALVLVGIMYPTDREDTDPEELCKLCGVLETPGPMVAKEEDEEDEGNGGSPSRLRRSPFSFRRVAIWASTLRRKPSMDLSFCSK